MMRVTAWLRLRSATTRRGGRERGQTNTEYALIVAGVAVLLIVAVWALGGSTGDRISTTAGTGSGSLRPPPAVQCDSSYPGVCIPPRPPDLSCADLSARGIPLPVAVVGNDPHGLDTNHDGLGCN
jgi:Flp pilus assembly pilin Flp